MKLCEMYGRLIETAIIVSEVFQNLLRRGRLDESKYYGEGECDTYATLKEIAENIESALFDVSEEERDKYGIEDIRELAEERILEAYGRRNKSVIQFSVDTTTECNTDYICDALKKANIDVLGVELKARWDDFEKYWKGNAPTDSN